MEEGSLRYFFIRFYVYNERRNKDVGTVRKSGQRLNSNSQIPTYKAEYLIKDILSPPVRRIDTIYQYPSNPRRKIYHVKILIFFKGVGIVFYTKLKGKPYGQHVRVRLILALSDSN